MSDLVHVSVTTMPLPLYHYGEDPFPPLRRKGRHRIYPYPMQDDLTDEVIEHPFKAVTLDNGFLRVIVLPGFGGHIFSVRDLRNDREVFYYNLPIKFGLIALRGAWYSGGIEFNFPQVGHTVTTNDPLPWHVRRDEDGSATVFIGTIERLTRMAWTVGISLRPKDGRLHIRVWLFNRTFFWHRLYFWTNAAVPARDDFRFLLPATEVYSWWWGDRGVASFPIHEGQDLSRYTTHKRPTDLFAKDLRADWFGCYYDDLDYGILHHASRFEVQGRKLWTWGVAEDGLTWIRLLSDEGRPYCEIQSGRFVHQGVHRLIPPRSVETWTETWFPVWGTKGVMHATDKIALNASWEGGKLTLHLFAPVSLKNATVTVEQGGKEVMQTRMSLEAGTPRTLPIGSVSKGPITVTIRDEGRCILKERFILTDGKVKADYNSSPPPYPGLPDHPLNEPKTPTEWLLKARDHEEQFELDSAAECYRKALALDGRCVRAMVGLAQWHLKRGEFQEGKEWAEKALRVDPQNEEALWSLGVQGYLSGEMGEERKAILWALGRSPLYGAAAFALLGEGALRSGDFLSALHFFTRSLRRNPQDSKALALAAFAARKAGKIREAREFLRRCEEVNPLEPLLWSERHFLGETGRGRQDRGDEREGDEGVLERVFVDEPLWLEVTCDYEMVGAWGTAATWLGVARRFLSKPSPLLSYHAAFVMWQMNKIMEANALLMEARKCSALFAFPHRHEDARAFQTALMLNPNDPLAHYLLGTWLASVNRWEEALSHWQKTVASDGDATLKALAWRNIGLMHHLIRRDGDASLIAYNRALELLSTPGGEALRPFAWRLWLERDDVLAGSGRHEERVMAFESAPPSIQGKPQVQARWAEACLRVGKFVEAKASLTQGNFKPWEGEVHLRQLWKETHMQLGFQAMGEGNFITARLHFEAATDYPANLNIGRPDLTDDADAYFWAGWCALRMGVKEAARRWLLKAATERQPPNAKTTGFKEKALDLLRSLREP